MPVTFLPTSDHLPEDHNKDLNPSNLTFNPSNPKVTPSNPKVSSINSNRLEAAAEVLQTLKVRHRMSEADPTRMPVPTHTRRMCKTNTAISRTRAVQVSQQIWLTMALQVSSQLPILNSRVNILPMGTKNRTPLKVSLLISTIKATCRHRMPAPTLM